MLLEDECHLVWGDACGRVWGPRNTRLEVPMTNERERQTYYGAVNLLTPEPFYPQQLPAGKGEYTVAYVRWVQTLYPGKQIILLWDGASYHRDKEVKALLAELNDGLPEKDWPLLCIPFAPNAPDQNPVEDIWLQGKIIFAKTFFRIRPLLPSKSVFPNS